MKTILQSKTFLVILVVLVVGFIGYTFFFKPKPEEQYLIEQNAFNPADVIIGQELLSLLARMRTTKIDTTIFSNQEFVRLEDFSQPIADQPIERVNPFAPFEDIASATSTRTGNSGTTGLPRAR